MVEALLFDLGGVVFGIDFGRCFANWAATSGRNPAELAARYTMGHAYERHERGELDTTEYFASVRQELELDLDDGQLLAGWNDIYLDAIADVQPLLAAAADRFPVHAFTNSNPTHHAVTSERYRDELAVFRSVVVSSELGLRKPERAAFEAVAARIGCPPSQLLFFDDSPANVAGARAAGLDAVEVTGPSSIREALLQLGVPLP